jgi:diguanylate cyclase (GGDEF)-like protein
MYLDLDGFKQVNDNLGHHAGDEVLAAVAERLRAILRREESVARLGGDEFIIRVESATSATSEVLARRVIHHLSEPYSLSTGETVSIGTSIGIAFAANDDSFEGLMRRADAALYQAKTAGKGTFRFFPIDADTEAIAAEACRPASLGEGRPTPIR